MSGPRSDIDADDYEGLLREVDEHFAKARFGSYSGYYPPFTNQYKREIRKLFPKDEPIFHVIDVNEGGTILRAILLRALTLFAFVCFCLGYFYVLSSFRGAEWTETFGAVPVGQSLKGGWASTVVTLFMIAIATWVLRLFIRYVMVDKIAQGATRTANGVFRYLSRINNSLDQAIDHSAQDRMFKSDWPQRSADWIKIAQWHARRYEYIDRYVTAVAWRIEDRFSVVEAVALGVKYGLVLLAAFVTMGWFGEDWAFGSVQHVRPGDLVLLALYLIAVFALWGLTLPFSWLVSNISLDRLKGAESNNLWVKKFLESVEGFDHERDHIIQKVASVVSSDKTTIMNMRPGMSSD